MGLGAPAVLVGQAVPVDPVGQAVLVVPAVQVVRLPVVQVVRLPVVPAVPVARLLVARLPVVVRDRPVRRRHRGPR